MASDTEDMKANETISVVVPVLHAQRLRELASETERTFSQMVRLAIRRLIESEGT